jgi:2-alkenal reductase
MNRAYKWLAFISLISILLFSCQAIGNLQASATVPAAAHLPPTQEVNRTDNPVRIAPQSTDLPRALDAVEKQDLFVSIYDLVHPGVVSIRVLTQDGASLGSGFVYDVEGHIVTNYHVVEGVDNPEVDFPSGFKVQGEVVGTDLDSDLAVIAIDAPAEEIHPLTLGDSSLLKVGQTVVAIGNPFGLNGTMTTGIISGLARTLDSFRQAPGGQNFTAGDVIQTDTAINPGNSGGPLLNLDGEVIGINRAIRTFNFTTEAEPLNSGIGFAIPINIIKRVIPELIAGRQFDYPYLGITSLGDTEFGLMEQEALGLPQSTGVYVTSVTPGGPADEAGLRGGTEPTDIPNLFAGGDLIIAIDDLPILTFAELLSYLINTKSPGDQVFLVVLRNNQELEIELTLGERP